VTDTVIELPFGDSQLEVKLPANNVAQVLRTREAKGLGNEWEAITSSLRCPTGCPALADSVSENDRVVVLVTDNTRPCPDDRLLPPILSVLEEKVPKQNITIVVALGLHEPLDKQQLRAKLGAGVVENYEVLNHDVNQTANIGVTSRGTPVDVNTRVIEADFRLSTGFIEPHFFAGFSGGRKSVAPGVSSVRAVHKSHSYAMLDDPCARAGILTGNPIHDDMVEQARMARLDFIVNVLLNDKREITHVVAGDPVHAHERGCEIAGDIARVMLDHKVDIAIVTNSGAPLDLDLYQTCKGIDTASQITRDGGIIIAVSSCSHGVGPEAFRALHASAGSPVEVLQDIRRREPVGVQWQNQVLARAQLKNDIRLVSNLEEGAARAMMVTPIRSVEGELARAFEVLGKDAEVAVIPQGPLVIPIVRA
jgi:nickel-dependent lactate racemase